MLTLGGPACQGSNTFIEGHMAFDYALLIPNNHKIRNLH